MSCRWCLWCPVVSGGNSTVLPPFQEDANRVRLLSTSDVYRTLPTSHGDFRGPLDPCYVKYGHQDHPKLVDVGMITKHEDKVNCLVSLL